MLNIWYTGMDLARSSHILAKWTVKRWPNVREEHVEADLLYMDMEGSF